MWIVTGSAMLVAMANFLFHKGYFEWEFILFLGFSHILFKTPTLEQKLHKTWKSNKQSDVAFWFMFHSSHIFVFWFLVFCSLYLRGFLSVFIRLAHLALKNVNKDFVIFLYFHNFIPKSDQKPKTKNGMNETLIDKIIHHSHSN